MTHLRRTGSALRRVLAESVLAAALTQVADAQMVDIVGAQQLQDGTKRVEVRYDLAGAAVNGATVTSLPTGTSGTKDRAAATATTSSEVLQEVTVTLPGGVPLVMIRIPAGTFQMGSPDTEQGRFSHEGPVHTVTITKDFYLGKYEVTQGQWQAVMGTNPATCCPAINFGQIGPNHPVYYVTWNDIASPGGFLDRLNQLLGTTTFRLPTEAEWEYAARAGTTTRFSFGDALECPGVACTSCLLADPYMWWCGNSSFTTNAAGSKTPNAWGLFDMYGSIGEWVSDKYDSGYYATSPRSDPPGPSVGFGRVIRGGSWGSSVQDCRSAKRDYFVEAVPSGNIGLRLAGSISDTHPPSITSFTATPPTIIAGGSATLSWTTTNATSVSIDQGLGVQAVTGSVNVSPTATTTYTLTATGTGGTASATTTVTVSPPPVIALSPPWPSGRYWKPETRFEHSQFGTYCAADFYDTDRNRPDLYRSSVDVSQSGGSILAANDGEVYLHLLDVSKREANRKNFPRVSAPDVISGAAQVPTHCFAFEDAIGTHRDVDLSVIVNGPSFRTIYSHLEPDSSFLGVTVQQGIRAAVSQLYNHNLASGEPPPAAVDTGLNVTAGTRIGSVHDWGLAATYHLHFEVHTGPGYSTSNPHLGPAVDLSRAGPVAIQNEVIFDGPFEASISGALRYPAMLRRIPAPSPNVVIDVSWKGGTTARLLGTPGGIRIDDTPAGTTGIVIDTAAPVSAPLVDTADWHLWWHVILAAETGWIAAEYLDFGRAPPPEGDFSWTPVSPTPGSAVQFRDSSAGTPTSWLWRFGVAGATSTLRNPTHTYAAEGTYEVSLTATNGAGSTTKTRLLTVSGGSPTFPTVVFAHGICSNGDTWNRMATNLQALNTRFGTRLPVPIFFDGRLVTVRNPDGTGDPSQSYDPSTRASSIRPALLYAIWYRNTQKNSFAEDDVREVPILELGTQLASVLEAIRAANGGGPVDIVAHSMGGLVSRAVLEGLSGGSLPANAIRRLVTIDTPHEGFDKNKFDVCKSPIAQLLNPLCIALKPLLDCVVADSGQKHEMDLAEHGLLLDPLNTRDMPPGTTVESIVTRGIDGVSDFVVAEVSQDLKSQARYACAQNVLTEYQDSGDVVAHITVQNDMQTAERVYNFLARANPGSGGCASLAAGIASTVYGGAGADSGAPMVTLTFRQGGGALRAEYGAGCSADVIVLGADGSELDRRTVPAGGTQVVQFGRFNVSGWKVQVVTSCTVDVSARVDVQASGNFGSGQSSQFVPVVLDVETDSAHYTSEITLTNRGTTPAIATVRFSSSSGQGSGRVGRLVPAGMQVVISNATNWLRSQGLALASDGSPIIGTLTLDWDGLSSDTAAAVLTRTTTATAPPQPVGAAGLAYGGLSAGAGAGSVALFGLRQDASDRSNLAVFNPTSGAVTVRVTAYAGDASGVSRVISNGQELSGYGWYQWSRVLDGTGITNGWVTVERVSSSGSFDAYGVINDSVTNDGSFITSTGSSVSGTTITVPALVEAGPFRSELVLANKSGNPVTLTLSYRESLSPSSGAGGSTAVTLRPTEQLIISGAIDYLRGRGILIGASGAASYAGALRISVNGASPSDVYAGARTASQLPTGGQFGLFTPGIYESEAATTDAYLYGLRSDELNRSNVAVANAGADTSGPVTLELHFFDGDFGGVEAGGTETIILAPGEWKQLSNILKTKGIRNGWVYVNRLSGSAPWIAYGVINDGGNPGERTGDGAYIPMTR